MIKNIKQYLSKNGEATAEEIASALHREKEVVLHALNFLSLKGVIIREASTRCGFCSSCSKCGTGKIIYYKITQ